MTAPNTGGLNNGTVGVKDGEEDIGRFSQAIIYRRLNVYKVIIRGHLGQARLTLLLEAFLGRISLLLSHYLSLLLL